jgi:hypothetical protein
MNPPRDAAGGEPVAGGGPMLLDFLVARQNPDGGWPHVRGRSWTEPTVWATLALLDAGREEPVGRALGWLRSAERHDGGWPPQTGVDESTWVTALVALLPPEALGSGAHTRAVRWLVDTSGRETGLTYRVRERLLGRAIPPELEHPGWPWIPGAAAWVGPTALAMLAIGRSEQRALTNAGRKRLEDGRRFLMARMCSGGGWNHGSVRALGHVSLPYPETTGMALAALRGTSGCNLERAIAVASRFLAECRSADALNWLRIGLLAHGRLPAEHRPPGDIAYRTVSEMALARIATAMAEGRNVL